MTRFRVGMKVRLGSLDVGQCGLKSARTTAETSTRT